MYFLYLMNFSPGHVCHLAYSTLVVVDMEYYSSRDADRLRSLMLEVSMNGEWDQRGSTNGTERTCDLGCSQDRDYCGISVTNGCAKDQWKPTCKLSRGQWNANVNRVNPQLLEGHGRRICISDDVMPEIDRAADAVSLQFKRFCPSTWDMMSSCLTTSCRIGTAVRRPFSTCTCTFGKQFYDRYIPS